ncbi:MAG: MBL fold metallo-hydrolase [Pseudomonadota bacterium]
MPAATAKTATTQYDYPFADVPADGSTIAVAPGVHWHRLPLPFELTHINVWVLEDNDALTLVDTGIRGGHTQQRWQQVIDTFDGKRPSRLLVTHMHPDHVGSAGWLCEHYDIPLGMTRAEYLMCRVLTADTSPPPPIAFQYYRAAGFDDDALGRYAKMFGGFGKACDPLPPSYDRLSAGQTLSINGVDWEVVIGSGHSPEHACLYAPALNVVISGDQILPTISSNVSVWPTEPNANPLAEWLDSCRRLRDSLPADVLVLPSHGKPFVGAHKRLTALIDEHEVALERLRLHCREPRRAIDVFPALFRSDVGAGSMTLATGEAIAHLNFLVDAALLQTFVDDDGIRWYQAI